MFYTAVIFLFLLLLYTCFSDVCCHVVQCQYRTLLMVHVGKRIRINTNNIFHILLSYHTQIHTCIKINSYIFFIGQYYHCIKGSIIWEYISDFLQYFTLTNMNSFFSSPLSYQQLFHFLLITNISHSLVHFNDNIIIILMAT